jgi:hypothetical protein
VGYQVTAPLVQARKQDGSYVHVYEGGVLPSDVDEAQLSQLVESGMVSESDGADTAPEDDEAEDDDRPAGNASQEEWHAYAVAQGMPEDEAASLSRNELRDRYSG